MPALRSRVSLARLALTYHLRVAAKRLVAPFLPSWRSGSSAALAERPRVTILITSANQRGPLEVTLRTLRTTAGYDNYEIWVADHGSTDGTVEMLETLQEEGWPLRVIQHGGRRPQHEWYDYMMQQATTPYWLGLHEDLIFMAEGWLRDLVEYMEAHPSIDLLGGQYFPPQEEYVEPVDGSLVDLRESLSTWVFCARTELRARIDTSFAYHDEWSDERQRMVLYDQGGKLIADMRDAGLGFACMPAWFSWKFYHIGNLSWTFNHSASGAWKEFKRYQIRDAHRRAARLRRRRVGRTALATVPRA